MRVTSSLEGVIGAGVVSIIAALIGWFTARTTTRNQLAGQTVQSEATLRAVQLTADEADRKRLDDQTAWIVAELRKELDRLGAVVKAQAEQLRAQNERIDQLDSQNIQMRRLLEQHGLAVPKP